MGHKRAHSAYSKVPKKGMRGAGAKARNKESIPAEALGKEIANLSGSGEEM
jgi:hypothetical protein